MRRAGQARRRDLNEAAIVVALEALGAIVLRLSGDGVPDLAVCYRGCWELVEVKRKGGRSTPSQARLRARGVSVPILKSVDEALALFLGDRGINPGPSTR